jgi:hypothetical protein
MTFRQLIQLFIVALGVSAAAQDRAPSQAASAAPHATQLQVETVKLPDEAARIFAPPLKCDGEGNIYLRLEPIGLPGFRRLGPRGERGTTFQPAVSGLKVDHASYFSLAPDGDIYQVILAHELSRYVFVYKPNAALKSEIKLQPGFGFLPYQVGVFSSGDFLVTGLEPDYDRDNPVMWPYEAIFSSSGTVLKELHLEDDDHIHDMAVGGDKEAVPPTNRSTNLVVAGGVAETGADGKVYLMRRLTPAVFYAFPQAEQFDDSPWIRANRIF